MRYRSEIDGLRAVAVLPVIAFHAGVGPFDGGYVGVDVFFVLSGYLITGLIVADLDAGRFSILDFYERRARRLLPALAVVIAACLPFAWALMTPGQLADFARSLAAAGLFASNLLFWKDSGYFGPAAEEMPLLHSWSLGVEEQFYLLFPPVALLAWWRGGRRPLVAVLAVGAALSLGLAQWASTRYPDANFYLLPSRGWELAAGALCALIPARRGRFDDALAWLGMAMILLAMLAYDARTPFPSLYALLPVGGAALLLRHARAGTRAARLLSWRPLVGIGLISYSAYLWHQPLLVFGRLQWWLPATPWLMAALALASLPLAWATWRLVETPFRGARPRALPRRGGLFAASAALLAAMVGLGAAGHGAAGFPQRLPPGAESVVPEGRMAGIRARRCHYTEHAPRQEIDAFLEGWDCRPGANAGGLPRLVVHGDSHAADVAMALRAAGLEVLQVTGSGCPLSGPAGRPHCAALAALLAPEIRPDDWIVLANRYEPAELRTGALEATVAAWRGRAARVLLLSPLPEFAQFERVRLMRGAAGLAALTPDFGPARRFAARMARIETGPRLTVLDSWALFCPDGRHCGAHGPAGFLYENRDHLAPAGAARFGAGLRAAIEDLAGTARLQAALP